MSNELIPGSRTIHRLYGRGEVRRIYGGRPMQASVQFDKDGDVPRRVLVADLVPEPAGMPACHPDPLGFARAPFAIRPRLVWPLDRAGEMVRS